MLEKIVINILQMGIEQIPTIFSKSINPTVSIFCLSFRF